MIVGLFGGEERLGLVGIEAPSYQGFRYPAEIIRLGVRIGGDVHIVPLADPVGQELRERRRDRSGYPEISRQVERTERQYGSVAKCVAGTIVDELRELGRSGTFGTSPVAPRAAIGTVGGPPGLP